MKKFMTFVMLTCIFCFTGIQMELSAQSSEMLTYGNNWEQDMKWGLVRQIEVDKDQDRIDVDNLDILRDGAYFMVFIPNNPTGEEVQYWGLVNGDTDLVHYCTSYLEIHQGMRKPGYYANRPYLGRADAHSSGLTTFTLLLDGTHHARWKTWATSGTSGSLVESSRGSHHRKTVENVTEFSITSNVNNGLGAGSKLLIYGKYKSKKPQPSMKEFILTEDRTEFTIAGLDAQRDQAYCLYFMPNNTTNREAEYYLYVNDDQSGDNYVSVWHGVENNRGPKEGGATFVDGLTMRPLIARADKNSSLTQHTWIVQDANGHIRYWCEEASGKYSCARAYGGYHTKKILNLNKLTLRSSLENGLAAGSKIILYSGNTKPYLEEESAVKARELEFRWYKNIQVEKDVTELNITNLDLKSAGFLHMDLIPNNRIFPKDPGGPGHYWSYVNSDMNDLHYCDAHFDVQKGVLCAIGGHLQPYYGWAYPKTSSHQPALFMRDANGHVRSRGYGTCHVQGNMQIGLQSICGRAFHHTEHVYNMTNLKVITDAENGIGKGTSILIYGGAPVSEK